MLHSRISAADCHTFPRQRLNNTPNTPNLSSEADLLISRAPRGKTSCSMFGRMEVREVNISPVSRLIRRVSSINRDCARASFDF